MLRLTNIASIFIGILAVGILMANSEACAGKLPIPVFVSIQPQAYFVNRVGGDRVRVDVLVRPGGSPATYAPTPKQMARLAAAKVFFRISVPFENAILPKINRNMSGLNIVNTSTTIDRVESVDHVLKGQLSGRHEDPNWSELDPHTWMDPMLARKQAEMIMKTLVKIDPAGRSIYEENYKKIAEDLVALDARIRRALKVVAGKTLFVYHPAYGYFCRAYGLRQKAVESGGKDPSPRHLTLLIDEARKEGIRVIVVQPQFSQKKARSIARAIHGAVVVFDPLASDYMANLEKTANRLAGLLR
jgi:zinc transport system substrate-binding protein